MVVSLCIRLFLPGCRLGLDQEYIRRLYYDNDYDHEDEDDIDDEGYYDEEDRSDNLPTRSGPRKSTFSF